MGLGGAVVGASAVGVVGVVRSITEAWFPGVVAKSDHRHQINVNLHSQRYEAIKCWRAGLAKARDVYQRWEAGPRDVKPPNVVGDEWFEGLRPHLSIAGEAGKWRTAHEVICDNPTLVVLSLEIGRIEEEWVAESRGSRRQRRKRR